MLNGCADCVRGSTAPVEELSYIMSHSQSVGLVVQVITSRLEVNPNRVNQLRTSDGRILSCI